MKSWGVGPAPNLALTFTPNALDLIPPSMLDNDEKSDQLKIIENRL
jgi:hypothetical protein